MYNKKYSLFLLMFFSLVVQLLFGQSKVMRVYKSDGTVMRSLLVSEIDSLNFQATDTVTDYDGNVYQTVKIGDQWWMAENLKATHYRDGTAIPEVTDGVAWAGLSSGAYCEYENNSTNVATYGRLYNWFAVNGDTDGNGVKDKEIAPTGWHVPTDAEWITMTTYLGGGSVAGGKMKETGTTHWESPNTGATNESGFTALPGGYRHSNGDFIDIRYQTYFWSSTESSSSNAWDRFLYHYDSVVNRYGDEAKQFGCSVRCVKD
jgi:uncharacterized protein (TIGR02145 family)